MTSGSLKVQFWISEGLNVSVSDGSVEQRVGRRTARSRPQATATVPSVSALSVLIGQTFTFTSDQTNGTRVQSVQTSVWADCLDHDLFYVCVSEAPQPSACVCVCVM